MKNIKINQDVIKAMNPCKDRFENYVNEYGLLNITLLEFLELDKITVLDKQWVIRRLPEINQEFWVTYALDCASRANGYAAAYAAYSAVYANANANAAAAAASAAAAAYAAYSAAADAASAAAAAAYAANAATSATSAAYAAYAADDAANAAATAEKERQIDSLIYLLNNREA